MKKSNVLKELEMTQAWLDIYMEKLDGVPGDTIGEKIDWLLEERNALISVESNMGLVEGTWKTKDGR